MHEHHHSSGNIRYIVLKKNKEFTWKSQRIKTNEQVIDNTGSFYPNLFNTREGNAEIIMINYITIPNYSLKRYLSLNFK